MKQAVRLHQLRTQNQPHLNGKPDRLAISLKADPDCRASAGSFTLSQDRMHRVEGSFGSTSAGTPLADADAVWGEPPLKMK